MTKTIEEIKSLSHAYQEVVQPADDIDYGYRWGKGYREGVDFVLSCLPDLLTQRDRELREVVRNKRVVGTTNEYLEGFNSALEQVVALLSPNEE